MKLRVLAALLIIAAAVAAWQLVQQPEPVVLPTPARILARMVLIEGDVKLRKAGNLDWVLPALPSPLQANDSIRTGDRGAAEVLFADGVRLRTRPGSLLVMEERAEHPERRIEPRIKSGEVAFSTGARPETGISAPSSRIVPSPETEGRIQVDSGGTEIEIRKGEARVETESGQFLQLSPSEGVLRVDPEGRAEQPAEDPLAMLTPVRLSLEALELKANQLHVKGRTDRGISVTVNGESVEVQRDGTFNEHVVLDLHVTEIRIQAISPDGATTEQRVPLMKLLVRPVP